MKNFYGFAKRIIDIAVSLSTILIFLPLMLIIMVVIKLDSFGPVVFKQTRAGKEGKPFVLYKFRTMKPDAEPFGPSPKSGQDDRLTKVGRFLREYSLDELPQLFNILKGDMSFVGPRPLYVSQISECNQRQKTRLLVKPGLTGLAQISGRAELTIEEKLELDAKYVETAGLMTDFRIIAATVTHLFDHKGIYEKRYSNNQYTRKVR